MDAVKKPELLAKHNITHIVSILPNWPSSGPHHLSIDLDDIGMVNLLEHLPRICDFIDQAVASGGVVLVHSFAEYEPPGASCVIAYCAYQDAAELSSGVSQGEGGTNTLL